jgi:hypothetical protein
MENLHQNMDKQVLYQLNSASTNVANIFKHCP